MATELVSLLGLKNRHGHSYWRTVLDVDGWEERFNPFRTAVPFWGQTTQTSSSLSPKPDCGSKGVNVKNTRTHQCSTRVTFVAEIPVESLAMHRPAPCPARPLSATSHDYCCIRPLLGNFVFIPVSRIGWGWQGSMAYTRARTHTHIHGEVPPFAVTKGRA